MTQQHVASRVLVGQIQAEGSRPVNARFTANPERFEDDFVTVTATPYDLEGKLYILVDDDAAGGAVTVNLPLARESSGVPRVIKKLGTTGSVTVDGSGSETIDGATTNVLSTQYDSITILSDGIEWHLISSS